MVENDSSNHSAIWTLQHPRPPDENGYPFLSGYSSLRRSFGWLICDLVETCCCTAERKEALTFSAATSDTAQVGSPNRVCIEILDINPSIVAVSLHHVFSTLSNSLMFAVP
jgi:hypothetical protein